jgi:NDP-sugar pyrophosphorylase family protein
MEAMILAAGAGTRLKPITDCTPKALVEVGGRPMLAHVLDRLVEVGVTRVVVNTHHHDDQIKTFVSNSAPPGVEIVLSPEPNGPYDTGGGLFAAAPLFREDQPFLLHNVDVLSTIPLGELLNVHSAENERSQETLVASLAVETRETDRQLLFDDLGLMGWENRGSDRAAIGSHRVREPRGKVERKSFIGIHVIDPKIFSLSDRTGTFSIIDLYLELAALGCKIAPIDVTAHDWIDVGTLARLELAQARKW